MSNIDIAQKHAIDHQLQSIRLGAVYGALSFAGLIAVNLVGWAIWDESAFAAGAITAIFGAAFAYANFTVVAVGAKVGLINSLMIASITSGVFSAAMFVVGAR